VRLTGFQPREDRDGRFVVSVRVQARGVRDLEAFLEALEKTGAFHEVLATEEQASPEGLIDALVEGVYDQPARGAAATAGIPQPKGAAGE
jgi:hypothetical protein